MKKFNRVFTVLVFIFLYIPMIALAVASFNTGKDIANFTTQVDYSKNGIRVFGLTGKNNLSRPNRLMQVFFVNGRFVVNKTLLSAVSEAYKNERAEHAVYYGKYFICLSFCHKEPSFYRESMIYF